MKGEALARKTYRIYDQKVIDILEKVSGSDNDYITKCILEHKPLNEKIRQLQQELHEYQLQLKKATDLIQDQVDLKKAQEKFVKSLKTK